MTFIERTLKAQVLTREFFPYTYTHLYSAMYYDKRPTDLDIFHGNDRSLFDSAWNRVRDYNYSNYRDHSGGVGIHEARHWHSRAYGGMVCISPLSRRPLL